MLRVTIVLLLMLILFLLGMVCIYQMDSFRPYTPAKNRPYAVLVQTNLVRQACTCGFCDPSRGTAVPEHINQIGYDLRIEVTTNYLPVVYR